MMKIVYVMIVCCLALSWVACDNNANFEQVEKPRVIITCDPELDDLNSLIRLVLYAPDMQLDRKSVV